MALNIGLFASQESLADIWNKATWAGRVNQVAGPTCEEQVEDRALTVFVLFVTKQTSSSCDIFIFKTKHAALSCSAGIQWLGSPLPNWDNQITPKTPAANGEMHILNWIPESKQSCMSLVLNGVNIVLEEIRSKWCVFCFGQIESRTID